jgi:hypothetical protein
MKGQTEADHLELQLQLAFEVSFCGFGLVASAPDGPMRLKAAMRFSNGGV